MTNKKPLSLYTVSMFRHPKDEYYDIMRTPIEYCDRKGILVWGYVQPTYVSDDKRLMELEVMFCRRYRCRLVFRWNPKKQEYENGDFYLEKTVYYKTKEQKQADRKGMTGGIDYGIERSKEESDS